MLQAYKTAHRGGKARSPRHRHSKPPPPSARAHTTVDYGVGAERYEVVACIDTAERAVPFSLPWRYDIGIHNMCNMLKACCVLLILLIVVMCTAVVQGGERHFSRRRRQVVRALGNFECSAVKHNSLLQQGHERILTT